MELTNIRGKSPILPKTTAYNCSHCGQEIIPKNSHDYIIEVECLECHKIYKVAPNAVFPKCHGKYMVERR